MGEEELEKSGFPKKVIFLFINIITRPNTNSEGLNTRGGPNSIETQKSINGSIPNLQKP